MRILDEPGPDWRATVRTQIGEFDHLIEQAKGARDFLEHALDCPSTTRPATAAR